MKKLSKKQLVVIAAAIVLGVGGTYAYAKNQSSVKAAEATKELKQSTDNLKDLDKKINTLFDSKDPDFLSKSIKTKQLNDLQEQVDEKTKISKNKKYDKKELKQFESEATAVKEKMKKAKTAMQTLIDINGMYQQTQTAVAINGSDVKKDLPIADDLTTEIVAKVKKSDFKEGATTTYDKTINELLSIAENQLNQIEKAKTEVSKVFKDNKVVSTDSTLYDTAKTEVDRVKNEKAKKDLQAQLDKVKADSDKKEKEEADKTAQAKQAEEQAANATAQAQQPATLDNGATGTEAQAGTNNAPATNNYSNAGAGYDNTGDGNTGGGYTAPPATGGGSTGSGNAAPPAQPSTGGNGRGEMSQNDLDQASKDAANADWGSFFP